MTPFAETSFLCALYRQDVFSEKADRWMRDWGKPLPVSTLVIFEFRQSIRLHARLHATNPDVGLPPETARQILRAQQRDLARGVLAPSPADWPSVHEIAEQLSESHTWGEGHRFADILHVATALHLKTDTFLTFDDRQAKLAKFQGLEGLES